MNRIYIAVRRIVRHIILSCLGCFSKPSNSIHILNGHVVHRLCPNIELFRSMMIELSKSVRFIRIEEAVQLIMNNEIPKEPLVAFTFDDGFEECATMIAPVLEEFGINGMFFVNPGFIDGDKEYVENFTNNIVLTPNKKAMTWQQVSDLHKRGHIIGAHTIDHYMINCNDESELFHQIVDCKKILEDKLQYECLYFAYPFGRLDHANKLSIDIACKHYKYVFSQSDYKHYFSYGGKVINRRHFEPFWPVSHVYYFLSKNKSY